MHEFKTETTHSILYPGLARGQLCTWSLAGKKQHVLVCPALQSWGSSPEASGSSLPVSALGLGTAWATAPCLQALQEASCAPRGWLGGSSMLWWVRPCRAEDPVLRPLAGSFLSPPLDLEQPGPQHTISRQCRRPAVHPETSWEEEACTSESSIDNKTN